MMSHQRFILKKHSPGGVSMDGLEFCKDPEGHGQMWPGVGDKRLQVGDVSQRFSVRTVA